MLTLCDYMIVQRNADGFGTVCFAGTLSAEQKGTVVARVVREEDNSTVIPWTACNGDEGQWQIELTLPQGGLYRAEARLYGDGFLPSCNTADWRPLIAMASHFGVGELFVMAGQSNMSAFAKDFAYDPPELGVHLYDNAGKWKLASHPLNSALNPIYPNDDGCSGMSPGLAFARTMKRRLGVPIGLISAARGASALSLWMPESEDCTLYKSMAAKIEAVGKVSGILWYQGCNEALSPADARTYDVNFIRMVELWRNAFGPVSVTVCQLNRHAAEDPGIDREWGIVRNAVRHAAMTVPDVYAIPTMDLAMTDGIHNNSAACVVIGERMATVLLNGHYKQPGAQAPNVIRVLQQSENSVLLQLADARPMRVMDNRADGMHIEDESGLAAARRSEVVPEGIKLIFDRPIGKGAVFHAYWEKETPNFFILDSYGMPLLACYGIPVEAC